MHPVAPVVPGNRMSNVIMLNGMLYQLVMNPSRPPQQQHQQPPPQSPQQQQQQQQQQPQILMGSSPASAAGPQYVFQATAGGGGQLVPVQPSQPMSVSVSVSVSGSLPASQVVTPSGKKAPKPKKLTKKQQATLDLQNQQAAMAATLAPIIEPSINIITTNNSSKVTPKTTPKTTPKAPAKSTPKGKAKPKQKPKLAVNLGDLLKETGILDSSPPPSPPSTSTSTSITIPQSPQLFTIPHQSQLQLQQQQPQLLQHPINVGQPITPNMMMQFPSQVGAGGGAHLIGTPTLPPHGTPVSSLPGLQPSTPAFASAPTNLQPSQVTQQQSNVFMVQGPNGQTMLVTLAPPPNQPQLQPQSQPQVQKFSTGQPQLMSQQQLIPQFSPMQPLQQSPMTVTRGTVPNTSVSLPPGLRLSITPEGNIVLVPPQGCIGQVPMMQQQIQLQQPQMTAQPVVSSTTGGKGGSSSTSLMGGSQPSPDSTTPTTKTGSDLIVTSMSGAGTPSTGKGTKSPRKKKETKKQIEIRLKAEAAAAAAAGNTSSTQATTVSMVSLVQPQSQSGLQIPHALINLPGGSTGPTINLKVGNHMTVSRAGTGGVGTSPAKIQPLNTITIVGPSNRSTSLSVTPTTTMIHPSATSISTCPSITSGVSTISGASSSDQPPVTIISSSTTLKPLAASTPCTTTTTTISSTIASSTASSKTTSSGTTSATSVTTDSKRIPLGQGHLMISSRVGVAINAQRTKDESAIIMLDLDEPFRSLDHALVSLSSFRVLHQPDPRPGSEEKFNKDFNDVAITLIRKKSSLINRFLGKIMEEGTKCTRPEEIMLSKLFVNDESNALKMDKEVVAQGIPLSLPPAPDHWNHMLHNVTSTSFTSSPTSSDSFYYNQSNELSTMSPTNTNSMLKIEDPFGQDTSLVSTSFTTSHLMGDGIMGSGEKRKYCEIIRAVEGMDDTKRINMGSMDAHQMNLTSDSYGLDGEPLGGSIYSQDAEEEEDEEDGTKESGEDDYHEEDDGGGEGEAAVAALTGMDMESRGGSSFRPSNSMVSINSDGNESQSGFDQNLNDILQEGAGDGPHGDGSKSSDLFNFSFDDFPTHPPDDDGTVDHGVDTSMASYYPADSASLDSSAGYESSNWNNLLSDEDQLGFPNEFNLGPSEQDVFMASFPNDLNTMDEGTGPQDNGMIAPSTSLMVSSLGVLPECNAMQSAIDSILSDGGNPSNMGSSAGTTAVTSGSGFFSDSSFSRTFSVDPRPGTGVPSNSSTDAIALDEAVKSILT